MDTDRTGIPGARLETTLEESAALQLPPLASSIADNQRT